MSEHVLGILMQRTDAAGPEITIELSTGAQDPRHVGVMQQDER